MKKETQLPKPVSDEEVLEALKRCWGYDLSPKTTEGSNRLDRFSKSTTGIESQAMTPLNGVGKEIKGFDLGSKNVVLRTKRSSTGSSNANWRDRAPERGR